MKDGMLASLMRKLGAGELQAAAPEAVATLQAEFDAYKADTELKLAEAMTHLETAVNAVKEADAKVESLTAEIESLRAEKAEAAAKAAEAKLATRKEKIAAAVGDTKVDALMAATNGLDDTAFDAVLSAMTLAVDKESQSAKFTEQGAAAEVDASKVANPVSAEMKILLDKYNKDAA